MVIGERAFYMVELISLIASIFINFYKEFQYNSDPNKMRQTILWNSVKSHLAYFQTVENQTSFFNKNIDCIRYNKVTKAILRVQSFYTWNK